jgi:nitroimidazol reductase NimA-like FMN-containing flavoprotein (pyridoxamine 5'-phosphate oxidase superfamily)
VWIEELSTEASVDLLTRSRFGRLACAKDSQPYVTPLHFAYHDGYIHSFSTVGQKVHWMRDNPLVCIEADEVISPQQWKSVVVFGRYEELPHTPDWQPLREQVQKLLAERAVWWEPGYAKTVLQGVEQPLLPVFFRLFITEITGRQAIPDSENKNTGEQVER